MAAYLSVANFDETEEYDFTLPANKVRLISGSLSDTTSEFGEPVELRFQTITKGTGIEIRQALAEAEVIFKRTSEFALNLTSENSIWININSDGERIRRALVLSWQRVDTVQGASDPLLDKSLMVISDWTITRKGFWEATLDHIYDPTLTWPAEINSGACQAGSFSGDGAGDESSSLLTPGTAPGRIREFAFQWPEPYTNTPFDKMWFGMKTVKALDVPTNYYKPFASFDDTWGQPDTYDSWIQTQYVPGMGLPTDIALNDICVDMQFDTPANPEWKNRISHAIPFHNGNPDNIAGTYQVLFRMRASDATGKFRTAMFQAWDKIDQLYGIAETYQDVFVESNEFHLYEMGIVQVPPENFRSARRADSEYFYQLNIGLAAERLSASGNGTLQLDYMILIPQEHSLTISNMRAKYPEGTATIITDEEDIVFGSTLAFDIQWERFVHELSATNWVWPSDPDRSLIVVVAADVKIGDGHHPMAKDITVWDFNIIPRYFSYNIDTYS